MGQEFWTRYGLRWSALLLCLGGQTIASAEIPASIREAVTLGFDDSALQGLAQLEGFDARYLRARLLERQGNVAEAQQAYTSLQDAPEMLRADVLARQTRLRAYTGDCGGRAEDAITRQIVAECTVRSSIARRDQVVLAAGVQELNSSTPSQLDEVVRLVLLHRAFEILGNTSKRNEVRRELWIRHSHHPLVTNEFALELSGVDLAERIESLLANGAAERALAETTHASLSPREAAHWRGRALFQLRRYGEAAPLLKRAAELRHDLAGEDLFLSARATARSGDNATAIRHLRAFARQHRSHPRADEALYLYGWLELRTHNKTTGLRDYLRRRSSLGAFRVDASWSLAFHAFKRGEHRTAAALFDSLLLERSQDSAELERARYWRARNLLALGRAAAANEGFRELVREAGLSWYGLWAAQYCTDCSEIPSFAAGSESQLSPTSLPNLARFYYDLGLLEDAERALRAEEDTLVSPLPRAGRELGRLQAHLAIESYHRAFRLAQASEKLLERPTGIARTYWLAAYPSPYASLAQESAQIHDVPVHYVFATMRQESASDRNARSRAGALGLLQVMPRTATRVARRTGIEVDEADLLAPATNIRIGIALMGELHREFAGVIPLVAAGYNAGAERVREWHPENTPLDVWVDSIPFDETRRYVKRVVSHMARYEVLQNDSRLPRFPWIALPH